MKRISVHKGPADAFSELLENSGYIAHPGQLSTKYRKKRAYYALIYASENIVIICAKLNTAAEKTARELFGKPNGKSPAAKSLRLSNWFFNGFSDRHGPEICSSLDQDNGKVEDCPEMGSPVGG